MTQAKQIDELKQGQAELAGVVNELKTALAVLEGPINESVPEVKQQLKELSANVTKLGERVAYLEASGKALEKLSDRSWGLAQAVLVAILSLLCGSVITLLVQLAIKH
ncbi:MAG: hypothetical protein K2P78_01900 [Gemmataceae bacterium]|nr:hypothetical protein [Gemmataceae bacterium]